VFSLNSRELGCDLPLPFLPNWAGRQALLARLRGGGEGFVCHLAESDSSAAAAAVSKADSRRGHADQPILVRPFIEMGAASRLGGGRVGDGKDGGGEDDYGDGCGNAGGDGLNEFARGRGGAPKAFQASASTSAAGQAWDPAWDVGRWSALEHRLLAGAVVVAELRASVTRALGYTCR